MADDQNGALAAAIFEAELRALLSVEVPGQRGPSSTTRNAPSREILRFLGSIRIALLALGAGAGWDRPSVLLRPALPAYPEADAFQRRAERANCHRFWRADIGRDLFGDWRADIAFGRIGGSGRTFSYGFATCQEAKAFVETALKRRGGALRRCGVAYSLILADTGPDYPSDGDIRPHLGDEPRGCCRLCGSQRASSKRSPASTQQKSRENQS
jgi:hypothetical protein